MKARFVILLSGLVAFASLLDVVGAAAVTEKVVYRFCSVVSQTNCKDGAGPQGGLIEIDGALYGTTVGGGTYRWGTVFSLSLDGTEKVLHSFGNGTDGKSPTGGVIEVGGTLYGTTYTGGPAGDGTVFSLKADGTYQTLFSFPKIGNGILPYAGLMSLKGKLFGTTINGGKTCIGSSFRCGTVFSIAPSGKETVVYSFCHLVDCADGAYPQTPLINVGGMLYGTTNGGHSCPSDYSPGCGTVFMLDPHTRIEKVLYSFCQLKNCTDGFSPSSGLDYANGIFYGTAASVAGIGGGGTVFSLTPDGEFKVLHDFGDGHDGDGYLPVGVINVNGTLYGTTTYGGAGICKLDGANQGCGIVFSISPEGTETVLYSFKGGKDGAWPYDGLIDVNGTLYGTTRAAGRKNGGTVFSINP